MADLKKFKHFTVSSMAFGTWRIGGGFWRASHARDGEWTASIKRAIELGITTIDTAEMYGNGHAEELVGEAIKGFERDKLFIVSKVWPSHASYEKVLKSAKASSQRLGTHIDLYLLHAPSRTVPLCETISAFERLVDDGIIRFFGLSNFDSSGIQKAMSCCKKYEVVAIQNHFSLLSRKDENDALLFARNNGLMYMAYTPLENGILTRNEFLNEIGKKYNKTASQVALNWYISVDNLVPIVKASTPAHVEENAQAMEWRLSREDWEAINNHFRTKGYLKEKVVSFFKSMRP
ncbi:aldo/keto reductase [Sulfolobus acidocaldarius]|uniref:Aldose reductase n=4 Tax=Sulfolobus acidocaldarius TaxID=2285 RepID=Q4J6P1_SULAC|nr:aldo/keto reductase [Sulfolobus acidocaldarius]AAY81540.1 aldose reductase [Sulfolobus acidocaldarius DSM 639]AGE72143.1 aldose reductase [Sulfolobus acidocaldarius N8]AGE74460.1 aldose reductase [Sulfolobus acidocaldarius Ron12/I]ALU29684.1 aldo/keto reductase [Sulfolobus acidocaldarius]ALU32419.1 aldo/keto reductase [Sulfolobus acidocaldarius]